jgi:hypothetical protein
MPLLLLHGLDEVNNNLEGMRLSITPLQDTQGVNDFVFATEIRSTVGDAVSLYFMLSDAEKNLGQHGYNPSGLRYIPVAGSTLQCIFTNINNRKQFNRWATQPFAQDSSIWQVPVLATDPVSGTVSMRFILTEPNGNAGGITKTCSLQACFLVDGRPQMGDPQPVGPFGY